MSSVDYSAIKGLMDYYQNYQDPSESSGYTKATLPQDAFSMAHKEVEYNESKYKVASYARIAFIGGVGVVVGLGITMAVAYSSFLGAGYAAIPLVISGGVSGAMSVIAYSTHQQMKEFKEKMEDDRTIELTNGEVTLMAGVEADAKVKEMQRKQVQMEEVLRKYHENQDNLRSEITALHIFENS